MDSNHETSEAWPKKWSRAQRVFLHHLGVIPTRHEMCALLPFLRGEWEQWKDLGQNSRAAIEEWVGGVQPSPDDIATARACLDTYRLKQHSEATARDATIAALWDEHLSRYSR